MDHSLDTQQISSDNRSARWKEERKESNRAPTDYFRQILPSRIVNVIVKLVANNFWNLVDLQSMVRSS